MKHNTFLITAALFCLATSALAADKKENAQPQSQPTEQTQMASDADASNTSAKSGCPDKPQKHAKHKKQTQPWDESQVPKNQVEYGGGG